MGDLDFSDQTRSSRPSATTTGEWEGRLGERVRALRLAENLDQATVAARAGIALRTVKNLENGRGSSISTLVAVVRALGREDWIDLLAPEVAVSPLRMLAKDRHDDVPKRASPRRGELE
jgi:transcriptional regulator with XRE-family HTH domain